MEAIAALGKRKGVSRVRDISQVMGVKSPSTNAAVKTLSRKGFVIHAKYGYVELTSAGKEVARQVQGKHDMLFKFLTKVLIIDQNTALQDACRMEHAISSQTFNKLTKFIQFVETGLNGDNPEWLKSFRHYLKRGKKLKCKMRQLAEKIK